MKKSLLLVLSLFSLSQAVPRTVTPKEVIAEIRAEVRKPIDSTEVSYGKYAVREARVNEWAERLENRDKLEKSGVKIESTDEDRARLVYNARKETNGDYHEDVEDICYETDHDSDYDTDSDYR